MRLFPVLTAALVVAVLYVLIFERERAFEYAGISAATGEVQEETIVDEPVAPQTGALSVVAKKSEAQEIAGVVLVRGRTEAARQVDIRAETSGRVISDPLRKGTTVTAGQLLCQLDPGTREAALIEASARLPEAMARVPEAKARIPEAEARLIEAQARVTEAEINLNAAKKLAEDGYASDTRVASATAALEASSAAVQSARAGLASTGSGVEAAQAGIKAAEAGIAAAERAIAQLEITASFGGFLESDTAETGALLQPGALCATVIQLDPIKLVGFIPEIEVGRVTTGSTAGARLSDGTEILGQVSFLSRSADPTTRTFRVEITVPNKNGNIRDGQTVEMGIQAAGQAAHLLPMSALTLDDDGNAGVRTIEPGNIVGFMPVTILSDSIDGIWVGGLPQTTNVILVGHEYVTPGVRVDIAWQEASK